MVKRSATQREGLLATWLALLVPEIFSPRGESVGKALVWAGAAAGMLKLCGWKLEIT